MDKKTAIPRMAANPYAGLHNWLGPGAGEQDMSLMVAVSLPAAARHASSSGRQAAADHSDEISHSLVMDSQDSNRIGSMSSPARENSELGAFVDDTDQRWSAHE